MIYWAHEVIDLGSLQAGLGAAWNTSGILHALSLNPDAGAARNSARKIVKRASLTESTFPADLYEQLQAAIHGEAVEWSWSPHAFSGTDFQKRVWQELMQCPHGVTWSYSELASRLGNSGATRAVGSACGRNPFPLRVPCHRIIAANGTLGGFTGDLELKRWLLQKEAARCQVPDSSRGDNVLL